MNVVLNRRYHQINILIKKGERYGKFMDIFRINGKRNAWDLYGHYLDYAYCDVTFKNYEITVVTIIRLT